MAKDGRKPYAECGVCGQFTKTNNAIGVCERCAKDYDETGRYTGKPSSGEMFSGEDETENPDRVVPANRMEGY